MPSGGTSPTFRCASGGWSRRRHDGTLRPGLGDVFRAAPVSEDIDLWPVYERVACPTLALRGAESDLLERSTFLAMAEQGPRARTVGV
ncbi:hypothetical protein [Thauera humireducens]|uniref:alpha/beta fold hydrolase n=1 Tax=Thauera humireducens TaxID=1134435 RepID=UPI00311D5CB0